MIEVGRQEKKVGREEKRDERKDKGGGRKKKGTPWPPHTYGYIIYTW